MNSRHILFFVCLVSLVSLAAFAQPAPMASSKLSELQYFVGNWSCTGTSFAMGPMPEHATKANVKAWWTLGNQWVQIDYNETKDVKNPNPVMAHVHLGYDPQLKQIISASLDNMGGYSTGASDGWMNSMLVFDGPTHMNGMTAKSRETFTKKSATELVHSSSVEMNGKWQKIDEETCWKK